MKKKIVIVSAVIAALICCFSAVGCKSVTRKYYASISEIRDAAYEGECEGMKVSVVSGVREDPFVADGKSGEKKDFTVITVTFDEFTANLPYSYFVTIGDTEYSGVLSMHPFSESYSVELSVRTRQPSVTVKVTLGDFSAEAEAASVLESDDISADRALEVALKALEEDLKRWKKEGTQYEIYVRFIPNPINSDGGHFWYVVFLGGDTCAALINRKSGEVVGIKN